LPEVGRLVQRAQAKRALSQLLRRLAEGKLRPEEVTSLLSGSQGKALLPPGRALLWFLHGVALLSKNQAHQALGSLEKAQSNRITQMAATSLKAVALEWEGLHQEVTPCLDSLYRSGEKDLLEVSYLLLGLYLVGKGAAALSQNDSIVVEVAAKRFIALQHQAKSQDCHESLVSSFALIVAIFNRDVAAVLELLPGNLDKQRRRQAQRNVSETLATFSEELIAQATGAVQEFKELVRLLAIEDPFEGWKALGSYVWRNWPKDISAVQAIREMRE
jgi:protein-tyrosine-phosphatase